MPGFPSPGKTLAIIAFLVFMAEFSIMVALQAAPSMPHWLETLLDAAFLVAMLLPAFFLLIYLPFNRYLAQEKRDKQRLGPDDRSDDNQPERSPKFILGKSHRPVVTPQPRDRDAQPIRME